MNVRPFLVAGSVAAFISPLAAATPPSIKPGLWEYSMTMEMPGMPFAVPPTTYRHCLTARDIEQGKQYQSGEKQGDCQIKNMAQSGNKVSYDIVCTGAEPMNGHYDLVTHEEGMEGKGTITARGQTFSNQFKSRRVGDCTK